MVVGVSSIYENVAIVMVLNYKFLYIINRHLAVLIHTFDSCVQARVVLQHRCMYVRRPLQNIYTCTAVALPYVYGGLLIDPRYAFSS